MRLGTLITIFIAIVLGSIAAILAKVWLESQVPMAPLASPSNDVQTRRIVVASRPLRFGVEITRENVSEVKWPTGAVPAGSFSSMDELLKGKPRSVLAAIEKNEPILQWKITGPGQRATLSALISDNDMKATTIRVNDVKGVAGFVLPGDRVDIFLTRKETDMKEGERQTRQFTDLLLQNVKVLAVDQIADDRAEKPKLAKAVTVEVDAVGAQKIALATTVGTLSLALRRAGATNAMGARRVTLGDLGVGPTVALDKPEKEVKEVQIPDLNKIINVFRRTKREEVSVPDQ